MNFEETTEFLEQHVGKTGEVAIEMAIPSRDEPAHLAGFRGQLGRLTKSGAAGAPQAWYVWMRELDKASPFMDEFRLDLARKCEAECGRGRWWCAVARARPKGSCAGRAWRAYACR